MTTDEQIEQRTRALLARQKWLFALLMHAVEADLAYEKKRFGWLMAGTFLIATSMIAFALNQYLAMACLVLLTNGTLLVIGFYGVQYAKYRARREYYLGEKVQEMAILMEQLETLNPNLMEQNDGTDQTRHGGDPDGPKP